MPGKVVLDGKALKEVSFCYTQDQTVHLKVETPKGNC